jgi:hypothetical protein
MRVAVQRLARVGRERGDQAVEGGAQGVDVPPRRRPGALGTVEEAGDVLEQRRAGSRPAGRPGVAASER